MPKGGKRAGAGRPRKENMRQCEVSLPADVLNRFKELIPTRHRSEFLSDCLAAALRMRELLNEQVTDNDK